MAKLDKLRINWRQAAGESLLLLLGVLLALSAQAWWEARAERDTRREYINNLLLEVNDNQARLQRLLEQHEKYISAATVVANELQKGQQAASAELIREQLSILSFFSDFRPATSALENLVSDGGLGALKTPELRLAILKYAQSIDDHNVGQAEQINFFLQSFIPYLSSRIPLLDIQFIKGNPDIPARSIYEFDTTPLFASVEFENLILRRVSAEVDARDFAQRLVNQSGELQNLLQTEN